MLFTRIILRDIDYYCRIVCICYCRCIAVMLSTHITDEAEASRFQRKVSKLLQASLEYGSSKQKTASREDNINSIETNNKPNTRTSSTSALSPRPCQNASDFITTDDRIATTATTPTRVSRQAAPLSALSTIFPTSPLSPSLSSPSPENRGGDPDVLSSGM